jgi:CheY-like chemotaxis protein/two-component sensor histidine kinase
MDITYEPVHLQELTEDVFQSLGPLARNRGNRLTLCAPDEPILVLTDGFRLRQCLMNLISNAIKFTESGEVDVTLSRSGPEASQSFFDISVRDTGIGMSEEITSRLFQPFQQGDNSVTRTYGGTGLGLTLTREMMHLLGGTVTVESQLGVGSTFTLRVPARGLLAKDVQVTMAADETAPLILVIDADEVSGVLALRAAQNLGLNCGLATTATSALAYLEFRPVDLIILNLDLPDMAGFTCLERLRQKEDLKDTPIVVVASDDDQRKSISFGAQEHLMKPVQSAVLGAAIARLIRPKASNVDDLVIDLPGLQHWRGFTRKESA